MTVVNQVNVGVLNHAIQSLRIDISQGPGCYNQNYKEQAIQKILKTLETEMEFPAFLYDVTMDKRYYSSDNFKKASEKYGIRESDYWSPSFPIPATPSATVPHETVPSPQRRGCQ